jgi:translation initiation factor IF-3
MNAGAKPAVGKIMDYNRFKYEKKKKVKEQQKHQRESIKELKEYRLSYNIDVGDFETRRRNAYDYLVKGHKIKGSIRFRGREMAHTSEGEVILNRFAEALEEVSTIEQKPVLEGRNMTIILAPKKKN